MLHASTLFLANIDAANQPFYLNIILGVYMISYVSLVGVVVLFFSMFMESFNTSMAFKVILVNTLRFRLRWLLIVIFISLAALPPSFFFFSNLSLLTSVVNFGGWFVFIIMLGYVMFSWGIYYTVVRHMLFSIQVSSTSVLANQSLSTGNSWMATLLLLFCLLFSFFFEDIFVVLYWFLI